MDRVLRDSGSAGGPAEHRVPRACRHALTQSGPFQQHRTGASPEDEALQCTDVSESGAFPYNDFPDYHHDGWVETLDWVLNRMGTASISTAAPPPQNLTSRPPVTTF
jgi:hypothetical protein